MGQPAARLGDPAGHGGTLIFGAPTVLIGGMPAVRVGDPLVCPGFTGPVPHVIGNVTMGSFTVMIAGAFAARLGDMTGCGVAGVSGVGMPPVAGPPSPVEGSFQEQGSEVGDEHAGLLWSQHSGYGNDSGSAEAWRGSVEHVDGELLRGPDGSTLTGSADFGTVTGEYHEAEVGIGGGISAGGSGFTGRLVATDPDGNSGSATGSLFNASAGIDSLLGSDGRRTGIALGASAQASVAEGQLDRTIVIPIPFTDSTINVAPTVGGTLAGIGGAGAVGAYHDAADDRYHAMGMIDLEVVVGAKLGLDISLGHAASPPAPAPPAGAGTPGIGIPMTPGTILMGCPTVIVG